MVLELAPAPPPKIVHKAKTVRGDGTVSPLCAAQACSINLKIETWTTQDDKVTCKQCREALTADRQART